MITNGFITLNRSFMKWQWYDDERTKSVFLHLLLTANYEDMKWHGITVKRGQRAITLSGLAEELKIPRSSLNDTLRRLEESGDIERTPNRKFTIITLKNYDDFAEVRTQSEHDSDADRTQPERKPNEWKNNKKNKKYNNIINARANDNSSSAYDSASFTAEMFSQKTYERYGKKQTS